MQALGVCGNPSQVTKSGKIGVRIKPGTLCLALMPKVCPGHGLPARSSCLFPLPLLSSLPFPHPPPSIPSSLHTHVHGQTDGWTHTHPYSMLKIKPRFLSLLANWINFLFIYRSHTLMFSCFKILKQKFAFSNKTS